MSGVENFVFNQTMLRIKDPEASVAFYREVLGMTLLDQFDFPDMEFSLYFMGYPASEIPSDKTERAKWIFEQPALLELTHNYGTEKKRGRSITAAMMTRVVLVISASRYRMCMPPAHALMSLAWSM